MTQIVDVVGAAEDLVMLALKSPEALSDEQLERLLGAEAGEVVAVATRNLQRFPFRFKDERDYRRLKTELSQLSTDELTEQYRQSCADYHRRIQAENDDDYDPMGGSGEEFGFKSNPRQVAFEILKARGVKMV